MWKLGSLISLFPLFIILPNTLADRTKAKIYTDLVSVKGCFRRLNSDEPVGCQSSFNGNVGVIHVVRTGIQADLDFVLKTGQNTPYVPVLNPVDFTKENAIELIHAHDKDGRINGVIIDGVNVTDAKTSGFSTDSACPNMRFGLYNGTEECHKWNLPGSGLFFHQFPFPVFLVRNATELGLLTNCFETHNDPDLPKNKPEVTHPLCGVELHSFMYAAVSSERCLRRSNKIDISAGTYDQQCDPLGDRNVFGFLGDPHSPKPTINSILMVSARLDALGFFEDVYPGADSPATGIIALLASAHTLKKVEDKLSAANKRVLFTLFAGESFDYLGSNRVVHDMTNGNKSKWPVTGNDSAFVPVQMEHLQHFLELSQLGLMEEGQVSAFTDSLDPTLVEAMKSIAPNVSLKLETPEGQIPPASLQQFLKAKRDLPGVVLAAHKETFVNKHYNSFLDLSDLQSKESLVDDLTKVATLAARSVLKAATGSDDVELEADKDIVEELVDCYVFDTNCTLFKKVATDTHSVNLLNKKQYEFTFYVSVLRATNTYRFFTSLILAFFLGDKVEVAKANCTGETHAWMMQGGEGGCVRAYVGTTEASSPAISPIEANLLYSVDAEKAKYSAVWTESVWSQNTLTARIFLIPSTTRQAVILTIGLLEFILCLVLFYFVDKRSHILFNITENNQVLTTAVES